MGTKSDETKAFILEKVAPIFNSRGYVGTSLSDLTAATGLTKGAIYCNFKNKEDLAIKAFKHNVKLVLFPIAFEITKHENSVDKLYAVTNFYRSYYPTAKDRGGCPILNVGVDTSSVNTMLFKTVKEVTKRTIQNIEDIIQYGISKKEIKSDINVHEVASNIYCMIEGAVFLSFMNKEPKYLNNACNHIDQHIINVIKK